MAITMEKVERLAVDDTTVSLVRSSLVLEARYEMIKDKCVAGPRKDEITLEAATGVAV